MLKQNAELNYRTTFEILTVAALKHFADYDCDTVVLETGLGGRLDATNVVTPELTIITALGLDHQHILGDTMPQIAAEKAGIIKSGIPCVVAMQNEKSRIEALPVVLDVACDRNAELIQTPESGELKIISESAQATIVQWQSSAAIENNLQLELHLPGRHQIENLQTVLVSIIQLRELGWQIPDQAIVDGVLNVRVAARCEMICEDPFFVLDGAHCPISMRATIETVDRIWADHGKIICFSSLSDKRAHPVLAEIKKITRLKKLIIFPAPSPRSCDPAAIQAIANELEISNEMFSSAQAAISGALAQIATSDMILTTGSLYSIAPMRKAFAECLNS